MTARLLTIPFSHYCEKARWALERSRIPFTEEGSLPIFHNLANRRAGAGRTVPALVTGDGVVLGDSLDIVTWADHLTPGALLPGDPDDRAAARALEDELGAQLGPATRRWGYYQLLPRPEILHALAKTTPRWQQIALRVARPVAVGLLKRGLKIDAAGAERSRVKIDEQLAKISALLADGRRFLVGKRFSIADLTFAALAAPVLLPDGHPVPPAPLDAFPAAGRAQVRAWRATPAGAFALRMYLEQRHP